MKDLQEGRVRQDGKRLRMMRGERSGRHESAGQRKHCNHKI